MEDFNYYLWASIFCMALGGFFTFKASEFSGRKMEEKIDKLKENSESTNNSLDELTGEGSFPIANRFTQSPDLKTIYFSVHMYGQNTLKNIDVWGEIIENYSKNDFPIDIHPFTLNSIKPRADYKIERVTNGGNVATTIPIPNTSNEYCITLLFQGDYSTWAQYTFRTKINDRYEEMTIVVNNIREVLFKRKTDSFPITDDGYVFLNSYAKFKYSTLMGTRIDFHPNNLKSISISE